MPFIREFLDQIASLWNTSSNFGRVGTVLGLVLAITLITAVGLWSSQPQYISLASELAPANAAEIVSRLEANGIKHRLNFSGSTVLVDKSDWNRARLLVDDVSSFAGSTSLDGGAFGDSEMNRVRIHQQREESLARTIRSMSGVSNASVYLAIAEPSIFTRERAESTASIVVELRSDMTFTREQAATIVTFVANSVEGLAPNNVSVVDTRGRQLSDSGSLADSEYAENLEHRRRVEAELSAKANAMLSQLLGTGRAMVRVSADLDFTCLERTETRYDPDIKVPTQQEIHSSEMTGNGQSSGGTGTQVAGGNNNFPRRETIETNSTFYENSKTVDIVRECPGTIKRLTVAVMVDLRSYRQAAADSATEAETANDKPDLSETNVAAIVKQAVGFDQARGDEIEVLITEFAMTPPAVTPVVEPTWEIYNAYLRNASLGIASLVALLLGVLTLRKMRPVSIRISPEAGGDESEILSGFAQRMQDNPEAIKSIISAWLDESDGQQRAA